MENFELVRMFITSSQMSVFAKLCLEDLLDDQSPFFIILSAFFNPSKKPAFTYTAFKLNTEDHKLIQYIKFVLQVDGEPLR